MQISVDQSACVGVGQCAMVSGELFDQDDDGIVILLQEHPHPAHEAGARRAASLCPARAIRVAE